MAFNLTGEALRNKLLVYVDVSEAGSTTPEWEIQGVKSAEGVMAYNPTITTVTDILGETYTTVDGLATKITFDPNTLRMGSKLSEKLLEITRDQDYAKYSEFKVLVVYGMLGSDGAYEADMDEGCTINPNSLGGTSRVNMPFDITFSGKRTKGTVNALYPAKNIVFTAKAGA